MSHSTPVGSKRKAPEPSGSGSGSGSSEVSVSVIEASSSIGPAWVNFPANRPSKKTPFKVYRREGGGDQNAQLEFSRQATLIAGETGDMEFYSTNKDLDIPEENYCCQYVPAIFDPSTNSLVVHPSTPTYILAQRVKRLKAMGQTTNISNPMEQRMLKKDQLGETFGTRKAKSRIKAVERNKVDAEAQAGVKDHLMASIEMAAVNIPSAETLEQMANTVGRQPPPNMETTDPADVYALDKLIPTDEYNSIDPDPIIKAAGDKERMALLPFGSSRWIEQKLRLALNMPFAAKKSTVRVLYYIACIRQFSRMKKSLGKSDELIEKSNGMPKIIIDGLVKRFTERAKGSSPTITAAMENKLMAYQFALRLRCENYACDVEPIAADLQLPSAKVKAVFQSIGCTVDRPTAADRERLGMSGRDAKASTAILQAPPVFPRAKKGGPAKR